MTVLLLGVGADTTNASPTPPVYSDNRFEYIPIPDSKGPDGTAETSTYGNTSLRHQDRRMSDYLDYISPGGDGRIRGSDLENWPLHHDPNFKALTYGETTSRPAYVKRIRMLDEDDLVAFYTGLENEDSNRKHRYIIGYFTVKEVVDFSNLDFDDYDSASFDSLPFERQKELMERYENNAHAKRFFESSEINDNDGLVIIDGKEPGRLLNEAFKISKHATSCHYYLTDELQREFSPQPGGTEDTNAYLGGIKQAHLLDIETGDFVDLVS